MAKQKNKLGKWIIPSCNIHTVEEETLGRGPKGGGKEELGKVSFTKYLESQEDQDMTRLLNFTKTQERRRERVFVFWNE